MENDGAKQEAHKVGSPAKEATLWFGTILSALLLVALFAANGMLGLVWLISAVAVVVQLATQWFSKKDRRVKINKAARALVFLAVITAFGAYSNNKKAVAMDFARETGRKAEIICKEKGSCPDMLEGFTPGGHLRGAGDPNCSTIMNGYGVFYQKRSDESFVITVDLGGYERFFVTGSPTEPVKENHFIGS